MCQFCCRDIKFPFLEYWAKKINWFNSNYDTLTTVWITHLQLNSNLRLKLHSHIVIFVVATNYPVAHIFNCILSLACSARRTYWDVIINLLTNNPLSEIIPSSFLRRASSEWINKIAIFIVYTIFVWYESIKENNSHQRVSTNEAHYCADDSLWILCEFWYFSYFFKMVLIRPQGDTILCW